MERGVGKTSEWCLRALTNLNGFQKSHDKDRESKYKKR